MNIFAIRNPTSHLEHIVEVGNKYCFCGTTKVRGVSKCMTMNEGRIIKDWDGDINRAAVRCADRYRAARRRQQKKFQAAGKTKGDEK